MKEQEVLHQNLVLVMDALPTNIIIVNKDSAVSYANTAFENNFGTTLTTSLKKGPGDLLLCINSLLDEGGCGHSVKCSLCPLRQYLVQIISTRKKMDPTEILLTLDSDFGAEKKWFEVQAIPIQMEGEEQYLFSFMDISIYKKSSFQLLEHKKLAEAANRAKSEFLANMSHEIRTPLNGVIGMLELTLLTTLTEEQQENLEVAKNCADTLLSLINNILDLSKVESNKVTLEHAPFDLQELIQRVADTQTAKVLEKDLELTCLLDPKLPNYFLGDAFRLQQVLTNLLSNAVKFTERGRVSLEVKKLSRTEENCTLLFNVEDTGIGVSEKDKTTLFKPFSQVDGSISRKYGGTGLGLAISQNIIQLMGSEIKVKSLKGKGSVFSFMISLKICEAPILEEQKALAEQAPNLNKILVVEDDNANQFVIRQLLHKLGYRYVDIASNGFEAIKLAELKRYHAILMDIQMPELDGIDTTHIIREKEKKTGEHIPIIALTAHALKGDKEKFLSQGMDAYVSKPIAMNVLKNTLDTTFHNHAALQKELELKEAYASWNQNKENNVEAASSKPSLANSDKRLFKTLLAEVTILFLSDTKTSDTYIQIEKKMHELKVRAQRKEYEEVKTIAFRMELASRKKDNAGIEKYMTKLSILLKE